MPAEADLLTAIEREPGDALAWLALADCLEENGADDRAELVRLREWLRFAERVDPERKSREKRLQRLLAAGVFPPGPRRRFALADGITLEMTLIPPGSFWMGTMAEEGGEGLRETPRHRVTITQGFWLGIVPVTQEQWQSVEGDNPSQYVSPRRPVETVTCARSKRFCRKLNRRLTGRHRLPTEAEWEYACRAGTYSPFHSGHDEAAMRRAGWYSYNSVEGPSEVGQLMPNAWGLYDMHGNVYEWCNDRFRTFDGNDVTDPVGTEGTSDCIRGGYYGRPYLSCRSAFRDSYSHGVSASIAGFRVLRELDRPRQRRKTKGGDNG